MAWPGIRDAGSLDAAGLSYQLMSLPMAGAVLQVGAHPDDEDSGLLACLAHGLGVRTVYWSATRGEAGGERANTFLGGGTPWSVRSPGPFASFNRTSSSPAGPEGPPTSMAITRP